ncbi:tyrosine-type recombinase/integrase [Methylobacterium sp. P5_C11]
MRRAEYLQRRRGRWYVRLRVPAHLTATVGQQHLVRALDTNSETVARERRWIALALLWDWIGAQTVSDGWEPAWAAGLTGSRRCSDNRAHGHPEPSFHDVADRKGQRSSHSQRGSGTQQQRQTILALMEQWLKEIEGVQKKQSMLQHALAVREFAHTQPPNFGVLKVDRRKAGEFVSDVLLQSGVSQKTVNRKISSLSSMWRWLRKRGFVNDNPWQGQGSFSNGRRRERPKRAYSAHELVTLLQADPVAEMGERYGTVLFDLMRLGLLTGCRIGELCQLRRSDVIIEQRAFRIPDGKTENARRLMPVHRHAWPIIQRRLSASTDEWLISGLTPGGPDGKRSWIVVKRFATFRQKVLGPSTEVDFHSFRRSFATYLERASTRSLAVNSSVIAELMGHSKPTLALAVYSSGLVPDQLRTAIDALDKVIEGDVLDAFKHRF